MIALKPDFSHFSDILMDTVPLCCSTVTVTFFGQCQPGVRDNDPSCYATIAQQAGQVLWLVALPDAVGA